MPLTAENRNALKNKLTDLKNAFLAQNLKMSEVTQRKLIQCFDDPMNGFLAGIDDYQNNLNFMNSENNAMAFLKGAISESLHSLKEIFNDLNDPQNDGPKFWNIMEQVVDVVDDFDKTYPCSTESLHHLVTSIREESRTYLSGKEEIKAPEEKASDPVIKEEAGKRISAENSVPADAPEEHSAPNESPDLIADLYKLNDKVCDFFKDLKNAKDSTAITNIWEDIHTDLMSVVGKTKSEDELSDQLTSHFADFFDQCADYCKWLPDTRTKKRIQEFLTKDFAGYLKDPKIAGPFISGSDCSSKIVEKAKHLNFDYSVKARKTAKDPQLEKVGRNIVVSNKDLAILQGTGTPEYTELKTALEKYNTTRMDSNYSAAENLYEKARDYLLKKDTSPTFPQGKKRVAAAAKIMAQMSVDLLQSTADAKAKEKLMHEMKIEAIRNKDFREVLTNELPDLITRKKQCMPEAAEMLAFTMVENTLSTLTGRNALIPGKMWGEHYEIERNAAEKQIKIYKQITNNITKIALNHPDPKTLKTALEKLGDIHHPETNPHVAGIQKESARQL